MDEHDKPRCPHCENEDDRTVRMELDEFRMMWVCPECNTKLYDDDPFLETCY